MNKVDLLLLEQILLKPNEET